MSFKIPFPVSGERARMQALNSAERGENNKQERYQWKARGKLASIF